MGSPRLMIDLTIFEDSFSSVTIWVLDRTSAFLAWKSGLLKSTFAVSSFVGVVLRFLIVWFLLFDVDFWEIFLIWENFWKFFNPEICFRNIMKLNFVKSKFETFNKFHIKDISKLTCLSIHGYLMHCCCFGFLPRYLWFDFAGFCWHLKSQKTKNIQKSH